MFNKKLKLQLEQQSQGINEQKSVLDAIDRSMAVIEFTSKGEVVRANKNFLSTMGYNEQELIGKHHRIFCEAKYAESPEYRQLWERLRQGEFVSGQFKRIRRDGQPVATTRSAMLPAMWRR